MSDEAAGRGKQPGGGTARSPLNLPWRTGRHVGRTVYAQAGDGAPDTDVLIGVMDTPELAEEACAAHNLRLAAGQGA